LLVAKWVDQVLVLRQLVALLPVPLQEEVKVVVAEE